MPYPPNRRVIPTAAWIIAGIIFSLSLMIGFIAGIGNHEEEMLIIVPMIGLVIAGYALLVGYVHGDAKRRGMRYVLWTWLSILIPNGIGIILYFILRDPMAVFCSRCGSPAHPGYAFCPRCGDGIAPSCPQCKRVRQADWSHCPYCGTGFAAGRNAPAA